MSQTQRNRLNRDWAAKEDGRARWGSMKAETSKPVSGRARPAQAAQSRWGIPLRQWREGLPFLIGAFLCALGNLGGFLTPYGVAACAAAFSIAPSISPRPWLPAMMAVFGAAIGLLLRGAPGQALACVLLFGVWLFIRRRRWKMGIMALSIAAGVCALLLQWLLGPQTRFDRLMALLSSAATMVLVPVYHMALSIRPRARTLLTAEELVCVALLIMSFFGGLQGVTVAGYSPATIAAFLLTMACGWLGGAAAGAAGGTLLGAFLMLGPADARGVLATLCVSGLLAGAFRRIGRFGSVAGFFAGALAAVALGGMDLSAPLFVQSGIAGVLLILCPRSWADALRARADHIESLIGQTRVRDERSCARAASRLGESESLFRDIAHMLSAQGGDPNAPQALVARQYQGIAEEMSALREELGMPEPVEAERTRMLSEALDRAGLKARDAAVYRTRDGLRARVRLPRLRAKRNALDVLVEVCSRAAGRRMELVLEKELPEGAMLLELAEAPLFGASAGVASRPREQGPCGDSHAFVRLPDGRLMMAIADGMGSGREAAAESDQALTMLEQFLRARIAPDSAIGMINDLLVLRDGEEMYTTLDLCILDLREGAADFYKIGATDSYIRRGAEVLSITRGALPLGIIGGVEPAHQRVLLRDGDTLVMVSDGVSDAVREEEWLPTQLKRIDPRNPQAAAELLEAAARFEAGDADDRTVLCARFYRN